MSKYTPDTDMVRDFYEERFLDGGAEFDRWLAQHDLEVAQVERERLAKNVWEEKQKVFDAITKDPTNSNLLAYQTGLYRALDIIEGGTK